MSGQQGRGGMGSTKHGKSGTPGPNRRMLHQNERERTRVDAGRRAAKKRLRGPFVVTIAEVLPQRRRVR